jgi:hypothetical protein
MSASDRRPHSLELLERLAREPLLGPDAALMLAHLTPQELRQLAYLLETGDGHAAREFWEILAAAAARRRRPLAGRR